MADPYDFDEVIDRHEVPALKVHRMVLGTDGMGLFPAGVADMDFREPKPILDAMAQRLAHGVFGYETIPDGLMPALIAWMKQRHAWTIHPDHILRAPNVLNSLSMAANLFTRPGNILQLSVIKIDIANRSIALVRRTDQEVIGRNSDVARAAGIIQITNLRCLSVI